MINWTFRMPGVEPTGRRLASWGHPKWRKKPCCEKNRGSRGLVRWKMAIDYLVGGDWNHGILWLSHHIGNFIIPTDFNSMIFQMGSYTTKQLSFMHINSRGCPHWISNSGILWVFLDFKRRQWFRYPGGPAMRFSPRTARHQQNGPRKNTPRAVAQWLITVAGAGAEVKIWRMRSLEFLTLYIL